MEQTKALESDSTKLANDIRDTLLDLATDACWYVWQPDPGLAGFLQPPTPDGRHPSKPWIEKGIAELTIALGKKNHDRKWEKPHSLTPERTVYALATYQGGVVHGGSGNYKSQLMGSGRGLGSGVPFMRAQRIGALGPSFRADVASMLDRWDKIEADHGLKGRAWALWAESWDGTTTLPASKLDPTFIPLARLVRLVAPIAGLYSSMWFKTTTSVRVDDHTEGGNLGDPFTPLVTDPRKGHLKVRGTLPSGYDYREVVKLLFGDGARASESVLHGMRSGTTEDDLSVTFEGLAYENSKTLGYHSRQVRLPIEVRPFFDDPTPAREVDEQMMRDVGEAKKALRGAIRIALHGSPRSTGDEAVVRRSASHLDHLVDQRYVPILIQNSLAHSKGETEWLDLWLKELRQFVEVAFLDVIGAIPRSSTSKMERRVSAEAYLRRKLKTIGESDGG